jgi:hypothetical protein
MIREERLSLQGQTVRLHYCARLWLIRVASNVA